MPVLNDTIDEISPLLRPNIARLKPYSSARDEHTGGGNVWLDANENPFRRKDDLNRYPDPHQKELKQTIARLKDISPNQVFLGNGSDEAIDLLVRAFCAPGRDKVLSFSPTYGMYKVCADVNDVEMIEVPLDKNFQPQWSPLQPYLDDPALKLIFLCSPNNPTGNLMDESIIAEILQNFKGITVIDEAYIDFANATSWLTKISDYPRLVVLQTMSKSTGLAGIRLGMAFANETMVGVMDKIKPPYNISTPTQKIALQSFDNQDSVLAEIETLKQSISELSSALRTMPLFTKVYHTDANFLLAITPWAQEVYSFLSAKGIIVRNRTAVLPGALRISAGTPEETEILIAELLSFNP